MTRNVGPLDAYIRLTAGVALVAGALLDRSESPGAWRPMAVLFGSMKIAEAVLGWCPSYELLGISTVPDDQDTRVVASPAGTIAGATAIELYPHVTQ